ncbi:MAG: FtsQ-type POTRA domain-containing protein [Nitrospirota bacterium]|nr:FtsQ-type POTRA domain-containing protein [Nitrospirota bacterium]
MRDYKVSAREGKQRYLRRRRNRGLVSRRDKRARLFRNLTRLFVLWIAAVLLYMAAMGVGAILRSNLFEITKVEYEGQARLTHDELLQLSGIESGANIFSVDLAEACDRLGKSPWVREAAVRRLLPSRIRVEIVERVPAVLARVNGELYLVSRDGVSLGIAAEADRGTLPVVSGIAIGKDGAEEGAEIKVTAALELGDYLKKSKFVSSEDRAEIKVDDPSSVILMFNGVEIRVGRGGYEEKFKRLSEVESDIRRRQIEVLYIDLRFPDKVIIKPVHDETGAEGNKGQ